MSQASRERPLRLGLLPRIVIVLLMLGLVGAMAIQPTRQLLAQHQRITSMASDLHQVSNSNAGLEHRIDRLKDPDFVEERARAQMGLVRPGETTYLVLPRANGASKSGYHHGARTRGSGRAAASSSPGEPGGFLHFLGL